jgi:hypothetical protein
VKNKVRQVMGEKLRPAWIERTYAAPEGLSPEQVEDIVWYVRFRLRRCAAASTIPYTPPTHTQPPSLHSPVYVVGRCGLLCASPVNRGYQKVDDTPYEEMELLSTVNTLHKGNIERVYIQRAPPPSLVFAAGAPGGSAGAVRVVCVVRACVASVPHVSCVVCVSDGGKLLRGRGGDDVSCYRPRVRCT